MATTACALARVDPLLLAWAAGLFDGEGTTMSAARRDRPGYRRLEMSLPQCGHTGLPEVLLRFQAALLGVGNITGPDESDMYFWRASGFSEAQAAVALLWPQLGPVKRAQAAVAMRAVQRQYDIGAYPARGPRRRRPAHFEHCGSLLSTPSDVDLDLAWAAGFLDGEGHFGLPRAVRRKNAADWHRIRVSATQNGLPGEPPHVLHRLVRIFGGKIERHGEPDDFRWLMEGIGNVEDVFARVRPWLGTVKQEQARVAIDRFLSQERLHGSASHCVRGHAYSGWSVTASGRRKARCNACARLLQRMKRAAQGIRPRQFKNVARRYTI